PPPSTEKEPSDGTPRRELVGSRPESRGGRRWGSLLFEGIVSVITGLITFFLPTATVLAIVMLIAAWSLITGVAEIVAAIRLRKLIRNEWLLGLSGVLSIALGVLFFLMPMTGALVIAIWIGAYALVFGALLVGLGFRLRNRTRSQDRLPDGAVVHG
ncbi:MAG: HdeD family acid-resistance protein, partial [Deltaproteobacteria bacterium]